MYNLNKKELDKLINNRIIINPKKIKIKILKKFIKEEKDFVKNNIEIACDFADAIWTYYSVDQEKYKKEVSEINQIKILNGNKVVIDVKPCKMMKIYDLKDNFLGVGEVNDNSELIPKKILV